MRTQSTPTNQAFSGTGGTNAVSVTTGVGCTWTVASAASWITVTSGTSGGGNGTFAYSVSANYSTATRTGKIMVAGETVTINQWGALDTVGDGIPNSWRMQYFGDPTATSAATCATCDFDGTGQDNLFKYVAGLNPTNPAYLGVRVEDRPGGGAADAEDVDVQSDRGGIRPDLHGAIQGPTWTGGAA